MDADTLPAGAVEFFIALCRARGLKPVAPSPAPDQPPPDAGILFVSGTRSPDVQTYRGWGVTVLPMPADVLAGDDAGATGRWAETIAEALESGPAAAVIGLAGGDSNRPPAELAERLVAAVADVLKRRPVGRVFVEGGRTASGLVRRMGWAPLAGRRQLAPGVVALTPAGQSRRTVTLKPGSYPWPEEVWPARR